MPEEVSEFLIFWVGMWKKANIPSTIKKRRSTKSPGGHFLVVAVFGFELIG
tara:strand:+ start:961 stop:1113 length:153 start_codon:yes stop_codon:yes gene_type:complete